MICKILQQNQDSERVTIVANFSEDDFSENYTFFVMNIDPNPTIKIDPETKEEEIIVRSLAVRIEEKIAEETATYTKRKEHLDALEKVPVI